MTSFSNLSAFLAVSSDLVLYCGNVLNVQVYNPFCGFGSTVGVECPAEVCVQST